MLKVRAIVFRKKCRADLKKLGTSVRCTFRCNPRMSKTPTQHLYQIQLSFSCNGSEREALVCEYIDSRWNLESSHYSLKTMRPNTVLKLVPGAVANALRLTSNINYINLEAKISHARSLNLANYSRLVDWAKYLGSYQHQSRLLSYMQRYNDNLLGLTQRSHDENPVCILLSFSTSRWTTG